MFAIALSANIICAAASSLAAAVNQAGGWRVAHGASAFCNAFMAVCLIGAMSVGGQ
jgi:hypothetical protein